LSGRGRNRNTRGSASGGDREDRVSRRNRSRRVIAFTEVLGRVRGYREERETGRLRTVADSIAVLRLHRRRQNLPGRARQPLKRNIVDGNLLSLQPGALDDEPYSNTSDALFG